ncbi:androgen-dependent TFPI-regulating protein [Gracilinanus agilis]|uniref:androgen-dependent TFPI-regulating protein n=1 Tax=Gracilinanus agilis TaxID=191870 RepID=UPI001CFDFFC1|nr:androgen-dependent TFPI-regulating protein [Gracilinanus agilis]
MARSFVCIYHFLVWGWYIFINFYLPILISKQQLPKEIQYGGQWRYLTVLNLFLQVIFYGIAFLYDVMKGMKRKEDIKWIAASRDFLFSALAFPLSLVVFTIFWVLFLLDRELIYPKILDEVFPKWFNHAMHSSVLPISMTEVFINYHQYPSRKKGLIFLSSVTIAYISWVLKIYSVTKEWVYPIFAKLSPVSLAVFFSVSHGTAICFYFLGERLNQLIWVHKEFIVVFLIHFGDMGVLAC